MGPVRSLRGGEPRFTQRGAGGRNVPLKRLLLHPAPHHATIERAPLSGRWVRDTLHEPQVSIAHAMMPHVTDMYGLMRHGDEGVFDRPIICSRGTPMPRHDFIEIGSPEAVYATSRIDKGIDVAVCERARGGKYRAASVKSVTA